jgi:hypothetical protein
VTDPRFHQLAVALQTYGAYVVDGNTQIDFNGYPSCVTYLADYNNPDALAIQYDYASLDLVTSKLRVVVNNGPTSVGGGGAPVACFPPSL